MIFLTAGFMESRMGKGFARHGRVIPDVKIGHWAQNDIWRHGQQDTDSH